MQDRNKYRKIKFPEFIRYSDDKMSGKERNSFERELQKDPFSEEASEGFSSLSRGEAEKDFADLRNKLKRRILSRQRLLFYRIAASVAVLIIVTSLFVIVEKNKAPEQIAANISKPESLEITESLPVKEPSALKSAAGQPPVAADKKKEEPVDYQDTEEVQLIMNAQENESIADYHETEPIREIEVVDAHEYLKQEQRAATAPALSREKKSFLKEVEGRVISSEDNKPVAGASVVIKGTSSGVITDADGKFNITLPDTGSQTLIASYIGMLPQQLNVSPDSDVNITLNPSLTSLNEVVVTGYGVARDEEEKADSRSTYVSPEPLCGKSDFDRYIRKNLQWPDTLNTGQKLVVILDFMVHADGRIDSIKIVKSPGKPFSDEAIRLIRSGPSWKPAEDNGNRVEDHVRLRIVFK